MCSTGWNSTGRDGGWLGKQRLGQSTRVSQARYKTLTASSSIRPLPSFSPTARATSASTSRYRLFDVLSSSRRDATFFRVTLMRSVDESSPTRPSNAVSRQWTIDRFVENVCGGFILCLFLWVTLLPCEHSVIACPLSRVPSRPRRFGALLVSNHHQSNIARHRRSE